MNHKLEEWAREKLRPALKKERLILLVLTGMLLLVISLPSGKKEKGNEEVKKTSDQIEIISQDDVLGKGKQGMTDYECTPGDYWEEGYVRELEKQLSAILSVIDGAGEVRVMITLGESKEFVVEKDEKETLKQTADRGKEEAGTEKTGKENQREEVTVYETDGNGKEPFVIKQIYPKVEGVVVVAQGVGNGYVRSEISEAVQALFGLDAHKVKVLKLGNISSGAGIE